jgi:hypothetical protein
MFTRTPRTHAAKQPADEETLSYLEQLRRLNDRMGAASVSEKQQGLKKRNPAQRVIPQNYVQSYSEHHNRMAEVSMVQKDLDERDRRETERRELQDKRRELRGVRREAKRRASQDALDKEVAERAMRAVQAHEKEQQAALEREQMGRLREEEARKRAYVDEETRREQEIVRQGERDREMRRLLQAAKDSERAQQEQNLMQDAYRDQRNNSAAARQMGRPQVNPQEERVERARRSLSRQQSGGLALAASASQANLLKDAGRFLSSNTPHYHEEQEQLRRARRASIGGGSRRGSNDSQTNSSIIANGRRGSWQNDGSHFPFNAQRNSPVKQAQPYVSASRYHHGQHQQQQQQHYGFQGESQPSLNATNVHVRNLARKKHDHTDGWGGQGLGSVFKKSKSRLEREKEAAEVARVQAAQEKIQNAVYQAHAKHGGVLDNGVHAPQQQQQQATANIPAADPYRSPIRTRGQSARATSRDNNNRGSAHKSPARSVHGSASNAKLSVSPTAAKQSASAAVMSSPKSAIIDHFKAKNEVAQSEFGRRSMEQQERRKRDGKRDGKNNQRKPAWNDDPDNVSRAAPFSGASNYVNKPSSIAFEVDLRQDKATQRKFKPKSSLKEYSAGKGGASILSPERQNALDANKARLAAERKSRKAVKMPKPIAKTATKKKQTGSKSDRVRKIKAPESPVKHGRRAKNEFKPVVFSPKPSSRSSQHDSNNNLRTSLEAHREKRRGSLGGSDDMTSYLAGLEAEMDVLHTDWRQQAKESVAASRRRSNGVGRT